MEAPQTATMLKVSGEDQYARRASATISRGSAIPLLLLASRSYLGLEGHQLLLRQGARVVEEVGDRRPAEGAYHGVHHRGHRLLVGATVLDPIKDPLLALLPDRDEVLVHEAVQGRRH